MESKKVKDDPKEEYGLVTLKLGGFPRLTTYSSVEELQAAMAEAMSQAPLADLRLFPFVGRPLRLRGTRLGAPIVELEVGEEDHRSLVPVMCQSLDVETGLVYLSHEDENPLSDDESTSDLGGQNDFGLDW